MRPYYIKGLSQQLRREATREENHLWYDFLRTYPVQFRRQVPFDRYILDFYCAKAKLAIELDGSQHYKGEGPEYDSLRTKYLRQGYGIHVLRFANSAVNDDFQGVCRRINEEVRKRLPPSGGKLAPPQAGTDEGKGQIAAVSVE